MSNWFKRITQGILTATSEKKELRDGLWIKCPKCKKNTTTKDLKEQYYVCESCNYHHRISSGTYFEFLFDDSQYEELFTNIYPRDLLEFVDVKPYKIRLKEAQEKTKLADAIRVATGMLERRKIVIACMDFCFIGGSMGSVVGEKIARGIDYCLLNSLPLLIISRSGGARMMESAFSLMQMAKTAAKLTQLASAKLPYISLMTDPTTGGVTASFAMLGDINLAELGALIGFAGPRVIKETIKKELPEQFQQAEFVLEHGFLDLIVNRKELKITVAKLFSFLSITSSEKADLQVAL